MMMANHHVRSSSARRPNANDDFDPVSASPVASPDNNNVNKDDQPTTQPEKKQSAASRMVKRTVLYFIFSI